MKNVLPKKSSKSAQQKFAPDYIWVSTFAAAADCNELVLGSIK